MRKVLWTVGIYLSIHGSLFASNIPLYPLFSIDWNGTLGVQEITLNDQSVFQQRFFLMQSTIDWQAGDQILICYGDQFFAPLSQSTHEFSPVFTLKNTTRDSIGIALLSAPPQPGSLSISSITEDSLTLSDMTEWEIASGDQFSVSRWDIGDFILIGQNDSLGSIYFDAVLLNASKGVIARVIER